METIVVTSTLDMTVKSQRFPRHSVSRILARFNSRHFKGQNGRVSIVGARTRVKVLNTSSRDSFLCMESQLLEHPVIVTQCSYPFLGDRIGLSVHTCLDPFIYTGYTIRSVDSPDDG
jgi:hypothetical protein